MNLSPLPIQKFFDNNGAPLVGGQLFTYASGTAIKIPTYVDAAGTPNTNPIVLDFRGECRLWIDPTLAYKFILSPKGDTDPPGDPIWTVDNITAGPAQQDNAANDTGSVNNIALSIPLISSPVAFTRIVFKAANTNTGSVTITINGGTAKALTWQNIGAFSGGEIQANGLYEAIYDGAQWQLQGPTLQPQQMRTTAEISEALVPANWSTLSGKPVYDATRAGASTTASAAANSTCLQAAVDVLFAAGGGVLYIPAGIYDIDTPIVVWENVSILGAGMLATTIRKTTATPSPISDDTIKRWDGLPVGFPITCFHFVASNTTTNWTDAHCSNIRARGNTLSPNTTSTEFGFFFRGMSDGAVERCVAEYVQVGFFWGAGSTLISRAEGNVAVNVQRGFYQHFATSTNYLNNYAVNFRFLGYYVSAYYSSMIGNACDAGGLTWKVGTTEVCLAYEIHGWIGGSVMGNGCETHNGSVWEVTGNIDTEFAWNVALDISSNYTGANDISLLYQDGNIRLQCHDNIAQTSAMTGTPARHFMYRIGTTFDQYTWARNRFVDATNDMTNTSLWVNTSGTIQEEYEEGTYTGTLTGITTVVTATVRWARYRNMVTLYIPDMSGTSNATSATITGMPTSIRPVRQQRELLLVRDNGVVSFGTVVAETSGVLTLAVGQTESPFTNVGTKSVFYKAFAYSLV